MSTGYGILYKNTDIGWQPIVKVKGDYVTVMKSLTRIYRKKFKGTEGERKVVYHKEEEE